MTKEGSKTTSRAAEKALREAAMVQALIQEASIHMTGRPGVIQAFMQYVRDMHPMAYRGFVDGLVSETRKTT